MKAATRITSKGQIVIPKPVRERLRWRAGTRLEVEVVGDGVRLGPRAGSAVDRAFGSLRDGDPIADLEAEHRHEVERDGRRRRR